MKKRLLVALAFCSMVSPSVAAADDCAEVIKLSVNSERVFQDRDSFESAARNFCRSYQRNTANQNSGGAQVGYAGFSFGGTAASANAKSVAEQVCKSDQRTDVQSDAYDRLVQFIAPGAFASYRSCLASKRSFNVSIGAPNSTFVPITVNFVPQTAGEFAVIKVATDHSIKCGLKEPKRMERAGNFLFSCRRDDVSRVGSINVVNEAGGGGSLSVPWAAYTSVDGIPISLAEEYLRATAEFRSLRRTISGSIFAVESSSCPEGSKPYEKAFGRFLRGFDPTGELDPDRKPGDLQEDLLKAHRHSETRFPQSPGRRAGKGHKNFNAVTRRKYQSVSSGSAGGKETRPKNVAVMFCQLG